MDNPPGSSLCTAEKKTSDMYMQKDIKVEVENKEAVTFAPIKKEENRDRHDVANYSDIHTETKQESVKQGYYVENLQEKEQDPLEISTSDVENIKKEYLYGEDRKTEFGSEKIYEEQKCEDTKHNPEIVEHTLDCPYDDYHPIVKSKHEDSGKIYGNVTGTVSGKEFLSGHMDVDNTSSCNVNLYKGHVSHNCNYSCDKCMKIFRTEHILNLHSVTCVRKTVFTCDVCLKSFTTKYSLSSHLSKIHNAEKTKYECDICKKKISYRHGVIRHMKIHSAERTYYKCDICNMQTISKGIMTQHMKVKHKWRIGAKEHKCTICCKLFTTTENLYGHMLTHSIIRLF